MSAQNLSFYALYLAPVLLLLLYRDRGVPHVLKVSCANLLMLFYMLYDHIGLVFLYNSEAGINQLLSVNRTTVVLLAFYSCVVVLAYVSSGLLLGERFTSTRVPDVQTLRRMRINWFPLLFVVVLLTPLVIWKVMAGSPLLLLLRGDAIGALEARVGEVTTDTHFLGIKPSYLGILWAVLGFVQVVAAILMLTRRKFWPTMFFLFVTAIYLLETFSGVSKGAIVGPLYLLFFGYGLIYARGVIVNKALVWGTIYVLAVVAVFTAWAQGTEFVSLLYPIERLVIGNLLPQYVVVDHFTFGNLLYGATTPTWFSVGQHQQFLLDVWTWKEIMQVPEGAAFYTAPSSFVAEAHANFHVLGVVFAAFAVFFGLRIVDYFIKAVQSELMYTALMIDSSLHFFRLAISGAATFVVDYYYWAILLFALIGYRVTLAGRSRTASAAQPPGAPPMAFGDGTRAPTS